MSIPTHRLWIDFEATTLPDGNDYTDVHPMEVAALLTYANFPYEPIGLYYDVIAPTKPAVESLKKNLEAYKMHKKSGLLEDWKTATADLKEAENSIMDLLQSNGVMPGSAVIGGSGVAHFDHALIREKMPRLAKYLVYYTTDVGNIRRELKSIFHENTNVIPDSTGSYGDEKLHRARNDVEAHHKEMVAYGEWLRKMVPPF